MSDNEFNSCPADQIIEECYKNNCKDYWSIIQQEVDGIMQDKELEKIDKRLAEAIKKDGILEEYLESEMVYKLKIKAIKNERYKFLAERNKRITEVYKTTAKKNPENRWAKLASYVSAQAGCGMEETQGFEAQTFGSYETIGYGIDPDKSLNALSEANKQIFSSVGMPFMFISKYGYEEFYRCAGEKKLPVDNDIIKAAKEMEEGKLVDASDRLAEKEQLEIVEPIYKKYQKTFQAIDHADTHEPFLFDDSRNRQSIALEYDCDTGDKIPLGDLQLKNKNERVRYYKKLMDALNKK